MEIYRNATDATVTLELPEGVGANTSGPLTAIDSGTGATVDIFAVENNKVLYEFPQVLRTQQGYQVTIPWFLTRQDRDFFIDWSFYYAQGESAYHIKERSYIQVVTPLLPLAEIAQIADVDASDALDIERKVRHTVQSFTGQNFGQFYGVMRATGNGSSKLQLPAPLLEFRGYSFDGLLRPNVGVRVINNGWAISAGEIEINSIKQAPPEWMLDRFDYTGKIYAPLRYGRESFQDGVEYTVEGLWGYADVPADVRQAARVLVEDYSCDQSLWRDRYIDSIRAADWQMQFNPQAFSGTGNVQADQILSGYRRATMVVV